MTDGTCFIDFIHLTMENKKDGLSQIMEQSQTFKSVTPPVSSVTMVSIAMTRDFFDGEYLSYAQKYYKEKDHGLRETQLEVIASMLTYTRDNIRYVPARCFFGSPTNTKSVKHRTVCILDGAKRHAAWLQELRDLDERHEPKTAKNAMRKELKEHTARNKELEAQLTAKDDKMKELNAEVGKLNESLNDHWRQLKKSAARVIDLERINKSMVMERQDLKRKLSSHVDQAPVKKQRDDTGTFFDAFHQDSE